MRKGFTGVYIIKYNTQSRISLEILKQSSLNFAPEMYIAKETK